MPAPNGSDICCTYFTEHLIHVMKGNFHTDYHILDYIYKSLMWRSGDRLGPYSALKLISLVDSCDVFHCWSLSRYHYELPHDSCCLFLSQVHYHPKTYADVIKFFWQVSYITKNNSGPKTES